MDRHQEAIVDLVRLGLRKDALSVRQLARRILRGTSEQEEPEFRAALASVLVKQSDDAGGGPRATTVSSGSKSLESLIRNPSVPKKEAPIFSTDEMAVLKSVVSEQDAAEDLMNAGVEPTRTLLLTGPPGVGKTHAASFLAAELELPLITVDLSTIISSYLGRTGENVRRVLDYARDHASLLFLDEFDALAKRRDDRSDVGELKRIVNVLLLELDDWLPQGLLVAATNHSELLDPAVWRRFDRVLELSKPTLALRRQILEHYLAQHELTDGELTQAVASITDGATGSDLEKMVRNAVRSSVVNQETSVRQRLIQEAVSFAVETTNERQRKVWFAQTAHDELGFSQRAIGRVLDVSHVTVGRWLQEDLEKAG